MSQTVTAAVPFVTVADLLARLGDIPARRIRLNPPPGQATERDLLTEAHPDPHLCELVDGTFVEKEIGFLHAVVTADLAGPIGNYARHNDLGIVVGPDGVMRLFEGVVRIPDLSFISWSRLPGRRIPTEPIPALAPDLAVEVLSEGNTRREMERKVGEYFRAGARLVWLVDPAHRIVEVHTAADARDDAHGGRHPRRRRRVARPSRCRSRRSSRG
ncbi:MAG: Uma2 family endonuclease [Gemmataceae bacterium]